MKPPPGREIVCRYEVSQSSLLVKSELSIGYDSVIGTSDGDQEMKSSDGPVTWNGTSTEVERALTPNRLELEMPLRSD